MHSVTYFHPLLSGNHMVYINISIQTLPQFAPKPLKSIGHARHPLNSLWNTLASFQVQCVVRLMFKITMADLSSFGEWSWDMNHLVCRTPWRLPLANKNTDRPTLLLFHLGACSVQAISGKISEVTGYLESFIVFMSNLGSFSQSVRTTYKQCIAGWLFLESCCN